MYIYVNPFTFTPTHYVASWITMGAMLIHVAAKWAVTRQALDAPVRAERRAFLFAVGAAAGVVGLNYVAANVDPLHQLALLPPRRADVGLQGLPVQTQAKAAGVLERSAAPAYRLRVIGRVATPLELDVDDLRARAGHTAGHCRSAVYRAGASARPGAAYGCATCFARPAPPTSPR